VTVLGLQVGTLLGGSVITETIFAWPGVGRLAVSAIYNRDYPLIQGTILISAAIFVIVNLIVDLSYLILDPKIKYQ
jgi:peptide/nickel transport system permease protein